MEYVRHKIAYRKKSHPSHRGGCQNWEETKVADTMNVFDNSESRTETVVLVFDSRGNGGVLSARPLPEIIRTE